MDYSPAIMYEELLAGREVDLRQLPRDERLKVINAFLKAQSFRPLEGLGNAELGQREYLGFKALYPHPAIPCVDFTVLTQIDGAAKESSYLTIFSNDTVLGNACIPVPFISSSNTDEYVVLVKQYRPVIW